VDCDRRLQTVPTGPAPVIPGIRVALAAACIFLATTATHAFDSLDEAVQALGAQRHAKREAAAAYLLEQGREAIPAVEAACESRDPEVRLRARELLDKLHKLPEKPTEDVEIEIDVPGSDPATTLKRVMALLESDMTNKYAGIHALLAAEKEGEQRKNVLDALQLYHLGGRHREMVLAGGKALDLVEECLKHEALADSTAGSHVRAIEYAAWCMFRGTLDKRLEDADTGTNTIARQNMRLWLTAAGQTPQEALQTVPRAERSRTHFAVVAGAALRDGLLYNYRASPHATRPHTRFLRILGAHHRRTGNEAGLRAAVTGVNAMADCLRAAAIDGNNHVRQSLADTLLVLGEPARAAAIVETTTDAGDVFGHCVDRFRLARAETMAAELCAAHTNVSDSVRTRLDFYRFNHLAPAEQVRQLTVARAAVATGSVEQAMEFLYRATGSHHLDIAAQAATELIDAGKLRTHIVLNAFADDVRLWYSALTRKHSDRDVADVLKHALQVHRKTHTNLELAETLKRIVNDIAAGGATDNAASMSRFYDVINVGAILRDRPPIRYIATREDRLCTLAEAYVVIGDFYADAERIQEAVKYYRMAADTDPADPLPHYLLACDLDARGRNEAAKELKQKALLLTRSQSERCALLRDLCWRGHDDEALALWDMRYRLGIPPKYDETNLALHLLKHARDPACRARLIAVAEYAEVIGVGSLRRVERLATLRVHQGHDALALDRPDDALRLYEEAFECSITDLDLFIDAVNRLRTKKHNAHADRLFTKVEGILRENLRRFPDSSICLNCMAWFLACTHRKLDEALELAEKAVAGSPRSASYIDTLAEVHFQLGNREKAVELQKKAIKLEPRTRLLVERMKRFETGELP